MDGWIKLHRKSTHYTSTLALLNAFQFKIAMNIMLRANHKDNEWVNGRMNKPITVKRGQLILSLNTVQSWFLPEDKATHRKVRSALEKLENLNFLTRETTHRFTLVTLVNYGIYQDCPDDSDTLHDTQTTHRRHTDDTPHDNKQEVKKSRMIKNDKEGKKKRYSPNVTLTESEYQKLCEKYGLGPTLEMIELLDAYKASTGKPYKSDYAVFRYWVHERWQKEQQNAKHGRRDETHPPKDSITQGRTGRIRHDVQV